MGWTFHVEYTADDRKKTVAVDIIYNIDSGATFEEFAEFFRGDYDMGIKNYKIENITLKVVHENYEEADKDSFLSQFPL